ncbi:MAG: hypothetical protein sL5_02690 [Candidatus Mesenet longicola]|uniref:Uncharacterized protein n=1 Tax=Candidatus Mesenet longicola TaxID=1892558 RepID=A0A8J3HVY5_9RICK|nr:MAG: hypothetical protein sGL2_10650 [Candidatus Mesenet longicola]GHM59276.1 MAG: hypothetical protein sL5_02690 [Candidatus Mesenet longicola]
MLKACKRGFVNCVKLLQKVLKNIYEYIRKLFKGNVSQKIEVDIESKTTFVQEQSIELEQENILQILENNSVDQAESINNHDLTIALQYNNYLPNYKTNDEISSTEKSSRKTKHDNIRRILRIQRYNCFDVERIFGVNDNIFNKIKNDVELLKIVLQNSHDVDYIMNIYSKNNYVRNILEFTLNTTEIELDSRNRVKQCLDITLALYETKSIKVKDVFNEKRIRDSVLNCFKHKIEPVIQAKYQQKCNLDYLLKGVFSYKADEKLPMPSLQQLCIENLIRNTDARKNV